jgi:hypothetical protein
MYIIFKKIFTCEHASSMYPYMYISSPKINLLNMSKTNVSNLDAYQQKKFIHHAIKIKCPPCYPPLEPPPGLNPPCNMYKKRL